MEWLVTLVLIFLLALVVCGIRGRVRATGSPPPSLLLRRRISQVPLNPCRSLSLDGLLVFHFLTLDDLGPAHIVILFATRSYSIENRVGRCFDGGLVAMMLKLGLA